MATVETVETVWGSTRPGAVGIGAPECLGFWFELAVPKVLSGFRWFSDGRHPDFALFQLWSATPLLLAEQVLPAAESARVPSGEGWRTCWLHPKVALAAATPYLMSASLAAFAADFGRLLAAPLVVGDITVYQDGHSPNVDLHNGVYDATTDSSGRYVFVNPPLTGVNGHLYAIDVMVR